MKNTAVKYLVIATVLLMLPTAVFAHDKPSPHSAYACTECHNTHKDLGQQGLWTNLCVSCHKPGNPDNYTRYYYVRTFNYGDQANPYKNDPGLNGNPNTLQTSHRWEGSDNVPEAGAQPPTNPAMSPTDKLMLQDNLYCQRCHNFVAATPEGADYSRPYLRARIDEDQMCYDCHILRGNATSHLTGTHPVNVNYSTVRTSKPDEYYLQPVNANPANPSSQLNVKKVSRTVACMTCHGVHYTDSNSATFDKFSSAIQGRLSSSSGYLLRTDYKRGSVQERNICMNCHRSNDLAENPKGVVRNHNGKKQQNIQCTDCHGGHVEFAGYSTAAGGIPLAEKTPNVYLINRLMNISSSTGAYPTVRNAKVVFTDPVDKNYNINPAGVCIVCHKGGLPPEIGSHSSKDWNECFKCHKHTNGFSADCTACHGMPPVTNTPPNPPTPATGYAVNGSVDYSMSPTYKDESKTPHITHAGGKDSGYYSYSCDECHKGYSPTHMSGNFQQLFIDTTDLLVSKNGATPVYDPAGPGTCRNMYCHSDGNGGYREPQWAEKKGTIVGQPTECSSCHNMPPTTNSHTKHVATAGAGKGYSCAMCHNATVNDVQPPAIATLKNADLHVNASKDVEFSGFASGGIYDPATKACTNLYCHSDGRTGDPVTVAKFNDPSTGTCGSCHFNPMQNYAHPAHMSAIYGPQFGTDQNGACAQCHDYTNDLGPNHVNGDKDVVDAKCTPCHPGGANWFNGNGTCESCHTSTAVPPVFSVINNITAPNKTLASTLGHNNLRYLGDTANPLLVCSTCHTRNAQHLSPDPKVHFYRLTSSLVSATDPNVACSFCHNDATKVSTKFLNMSTHFTAKDGKHNMACWQCHELHGTTNNSMVRSQIAYINSTSWSISFLNRSTAMIDKTTNRGLCQVCHTKTNHFKAGVPEGEGHPDKNCFECHVHNDKGGAFSAGGCNGCHGYPPVPRSATFGAEDTNNYKGTYGTFNNYTNARFEDYTGGGGAHLWHVAQNAKASDKWLHCTKCHGGGSMSPSTHVGKKPIKGNISKVTINMDPRYRFSDETFPRYTSAVLVYPGNQTGSCVNVMCHFQPTPKWSKDR